MRRIEWASALGICLLLLTPTLFMLARFPQSPDGAELVSTAVLGGVLHPSGLPLQAWLDKLFAPVFPATPALGLSLLSWLANLLGCTLMFMTLRKLSASRTVAAVSILFYFSYSAVWAMAIQPEKYALVALTIFFFLYILVSILQEAARPRRSDFWLLGFAFAVALAQHTACVFLFPALLVPAFISSRKNGLKTTGVWTAESALAAATVAIGFYASLFWLRSSAPWPDWGAIENWADLWNHFLRTDFNNGIISADQRPSEDAVSGLTFLLQGLPQWTVGLLAMGLGTWTLARRDRALAGALLAVSVLAVAVLVKAELPAIDHDTAYGYGERYQLILLPLFSLLLGLGLVEAQRRARSRKLLLAVLYLAVASALGFSIFTGYQVNKSVDNSLIEIYRKEAALELPDQALFFSTNEIDLFYGLSCRRGICFPIKNMFGLPWYRERSALAIDPRVKGLLDGFNAGNWSYPAFLNKAVASGIELASTSGDLLIGIPSLHGHIEQHGLIWTATPAARALYTQEIVDSAVRLCTDLRAKPVYLPKEGLYFIHGLQEKISLVFTSAGDFLNQSGAGTNAKDAWAVAESLRPGVASAAQAARCETFLSHLR